MSGALKALKKFEYKPKSFVPLGASSSVFCREAEKDSPSGLPSLSGNSFSSLFKRLLPGKTYVVEERLEDSELLSYYLSSYKFDHYKTQEKKNKEEEQPTLVLLNNTEESLLHAEKVASAVFLTRGLINSPAEHCTPSHLQRVMESISSRHSGSSCKTYVGAQLLESNEVFGEVMDGGLCGQIHAVGRAAAESCAPRLIDFTFNQNNEDYPSVTLVGKGVCFDTGGLSMKSPAGMLNMKKDMGGAAQVCGLASAIVDLDLPVNLRVLVPAVENSVASNSIRPLDIITAVNGLTTEIGNTDAEGRLILADALGKPDQSSAQPF